MRGRRPYFRGHFAGLALLLALGGCRNAPTQDAPAFAISREGDVQPAAQAGGAAPNGTITPPATPPVAPAVPGTAPPNPSGGTVTAAANDRTVIDLGSSKVVVTLGDAKAVRAALLARLAQSKSVYRDYLIDMAKVGDITLQDRHVEIGRWALQEWSGRLVVMHRGPNASTFHTADVANSAGGWSVQEPRLGEMFMRR